MNQEKIKLNRLKRLLMEVADDLLESNHTPQFHTILSIQAPDYQKAKSWLKKYGHLLEVDF